MNPSCIIRHFEHYSQLTDLDRDLLASLEKGPQKYAKHTALWQQGAPSDQFFTVKCGWAYAYRDMEDGSRQVLDIYVPGDIIGLREFAFNKRLTGVMTLSDAEVCAFPKTRLTDVFSESLLLCSIFFIIASRDQAVLMERLVNLGRRSARERLAHFLIEIANRLRKTNDNIGNQTRIPATQALLADALGLSVVHVNRTFSSLKKEGLVVPYSGGVELADVAALEEVGCFDPNYLVESTGTMLQHVRDTRLWTEKHNPTPGSATTAG